jgi:transcriptional regulator with XRE-family HTH domain
MRLKLRQVRRARDITQQELANRIHVAQNTISGWEHSKKMPPVDKCLAMASVLGVSLFDLIESEATDEPQPEPGA